MEKNINLKKRKFIISVIFLVWGIAVLLLLPLLSAEIQTLGVFKQNTCITLKQICDNCTSVNITSVIYPNSSSAYGIVNMSKTGTDYSLPNFCNTSVVGTYIVNGVGDLNGVNQAWNFDFEVSRTGSRLTTAQSLIYIIALTLSVLLFLLFFYYSYSIPFRNTRADDGKIISINDLKYLKIFFIGISYAMLLLIVGIMRGISFHFLTYDGIEKIFNWIYWLMLSFIYPILVVSAIFLLVIFLEDKKLKKRILRGAFR